MKIVGVLSDIRSVHNVGSLFRTADAAGVDALYLCGVTPSPLDRFKNVRSDFAKVALGAERFIRWEKEENVIAAIQKLKAEGFLIFALEQAHSAIPYYEAFAALRNTLHNGKDLKIALLVGPEVEGLAPELLVFADQIIEIPMKGVLSTDARHPAATGQGKESLNVSVAFGIAVFGLREVTGEWRIIEHNDPSD